MGFLLKDNVWCYNGNTLHDTNCWDLTPAGCYFWLTTGSNPSGQGALIPHKTNPYVLAPLADLPVFINSGSAYKEIWYTDLNKPYGDPAQQRTLNFLSLSSLPSSLLSLSYDDTYWPTLLSPEQCAAIVSIGGHVPYYDMHPIAGCWNDTPSSPAELLGRLASFWNDSVLWVEPRSNDVVFSFCGTSYFQHFQAEFGTNLSMTEVGENIGLIHSRLAFTRGSGAQYLKAWGLG